MALDYLGYARMAHAGYHAVRTAHHHRHRFVVALSFLVPMLTYALSISHAVASREIAEMQGVPYLLGIAHPTGYPLFALLGWLFSHAIAVDTIAYRMNLFGAFCTSLTCVVGVITALRIGIGPVTSLGAFLCFAWTRIVWFHGAQADAQDLALLFQAMTIYYLCGWLIHGRTRDIVAMSASFGAALAVHPISLWLVPAIAFAKLARLRSITFANGGAALMAFVLLLCCYAYLPLRSSYIETHPVDAVQLQAPPAARVFWDVNAPSTRSGFLTEISGTTFGAYPLWRSLVNPQHWLSYLRSIYTNERAAYDIVFIVVAALGIILLLQRRSTVCIMLLIALVSSSAVAIALSPVEGDPSRYWMLPLWIGALFAGGVTAEFRWNIDPRRMVWALILLGNAIYLVGHSSAVAGQQRSVSNRPVIDWLSRNVPARAIVVAPWQDATTLAYGAYVDDSFGGRTIVAAHPMALASQYAAWAQSEPVFVVTTATIANSRFREIGSQTLGHYLYQFSP